MALWHWPLLGQQLHSLISRQDTKEQIQYALYAVIGRATLYNALPIEVRRMIGAWLFQMLLTQSRVWAVPSSVIDWHKHSPASVRCHAMLEYAKSVDYPLVIGDTVMVEGVQPPCLFDGCRLLLLFGNNSRGLMCKLLYRQVGADLFPQDYWDKCKDRDSAVE